MRSERSHRAQLVTNGLLRAPGGSVRGLTLNGQRRRKYMYHFHSLNCSVECCQARLGRWGWAQTLLSSRCQDRVLLLGRPTEQVLNAMLTARGAYAGHTGMNCSLRSVQCSPVVDFTVSNSIRQWPIMATILNRLGSLATS